MSFDVIEPPSDASIGVDAVNFLIPGSVLICVFSKQRMGAGIGEAAIDAFVGRALLIGFSNYALVVQLHSD